VELALLRPIQRRMRRGQPPRAVPPPGAHARVAARFGASSLSLSLRLPFVR